MWVLLMNLASMANALGSQGKVETSNIGCDISGLQSTKGYSANVYTYPLDNTQYYSQTDYYLSSYAMSAPITTGILSSGQFLQTVNANDVETGTIGSLVFPVSNFAMELTGYFYGKFLPAEHHFFFSY